MLYTLLFGILCVVLEVGSAIRATPPSSNGRRSHCSPMSPSSSSRTCPGRGAAPLVVPELQWNAALCDGDGGDSRHDDQPLPLLLAGGPGDRGGAPAPCQAALPHAARGQAELKRIRTDTLVGMAFSSIVSLAIVFATAATLNANGISDIETSAQAAEALRPVAGQFAFAMFALGIIGTGLLAVPVLAGFGGLCGDRDGGARREASMPSRSGRAAVLCDDRGDDARRRRARPRSRSILPARSTGPRWSTACSRRL